MKKRILMTGLLLVSLALTGPTLAADMDMSHQGHDMGSMDHSAHQERGGENIHNAMVNDFHFAYHLIDMKAKMAKLNMSMPGMKSHHLMVYVGKHGEAPLTNARVGYVLTDASGNEQKVMAMGMADGYGADIDLVPGQEVTIKVKVMAGDTKLMDEFNYTLK